MSIRLLCSRKRLPGEFQAVDENLRVAMRFFGGATGSGDICALAGVDAIFSGLDYGVFNIAVLSQPVGAGESLELRLKECVRYYEPRTPRWSFWLCEDLLEAAVRRRSRAVFAEMGLRVISQPPGMLAERLRPRSWDLPQVEVCPVADQATRDIFTGITSTCFDIPINVANSVYRPERAWQGAYRGYIAALKGRPVAIIATVETPGALGIYSLATLPEFRRQGIAEALLRAVVERQEQTSGPRAIVLQATELGYRMYRRVGFRDVAKFSVYLTR
jgi:GNAT superfamily N-acetyltransferase